ncbi:MAG: CBS domain-containing protein [Bacteroidia bacterium]|nr:CBS domain-containing protein [Bacteroidia bacterium]
MSGLRLRAIDYVQYRRLFISEAHTVKDARRLFHKHHQLAHLAVVSSEGRYVAFLSRRSLRNNPPDRPIKEIADYTFSPLSAQATIYEAIWKMEQDRVLEMPVVSSDGIYMGLLTPRGIIRWWAQFGAVHEPGSVLVIDSDLHSYSLTEIAQCLESDGIRILWVSLLSHSSDVRRVFVILKVNSIYLSRSIALLERKGYRVVAVYGDAAMELQAQEQLRALLRYLDI